MADVAAIDGVTGPGRRTLLFEEGIQEITFRLKKKVIEITNRDGSIGQYDLAQVTRIDVTSSGQDDFTVSVMSVSREETDERTERDEKRATTISAGTPEAAPNPPRAGNKGTEGKSGNTPENR
jgi:hypothetical protein